MYMYVYRYNIYIWGFSIAMLVYPECTKMGSSPRTNSYQYRRIEQLLTKSANVRCGMDQKFHDEWLHPSASHDSGGPVIM